MRYLLSLLLFVSVAFGQNVNDKNFKERYTLNLKHNFDKNDNIIFFSNFLLNKNINKKIFLAKKKLKNIK